MKSKFNLKSAITVLTNFLVFVLGGFGVPFFVWVQKQISTMDGNWFAFWCVLLAYCIITRKTL